MLENAHMLKHLYLEHLQWSEGGYKTLDLKPYKGYAHIEARTTGGNVGTGSLSRR